MPADPDPDLGLRGRLILSLGSLREMLPASSVRRKRACGLPNCRCADGESSHTRYQIPGLVHGQPKTFHILAALVEQVRKKIELRRRFEAVAATICEFNLSRFQKQQKEEQWRAPAPVRDVSRQGV